MSRRSAEKHCVHCLNRIGSSLTSLGDGTLGTEGMRSTSKDASAATAMMQDEVAVMEQRLQQLRTTMSAERERRTAAQKANPSGTQ